MNKLFLAVFVVAIGASYGGLLIDRLQGVISKLPYMCNVDKDCGENRCCLIGKICAPRLGANMPCEGLLGPLHKCGCREGLECKVTKTISISMLGMNFFKKIKQCRAVDEEVTPEEIHREMDEPMRQKRFIRRCSQDSDCGIKRCCVQPPFGFSKRCIPTFLKYTPCSEATKHCCRQGLVCRSGFTVVTGNGDGQEGTLVDLKVCQEPLPSE